MKRRSREVRNALASCRAAFVGIAVFSGAISILMLTGSVYMLQVYDRVLTSRSIPTLIGLSMIVLAAYLLQGALDSLRAKMLARVGARLDEVLSGRIFDLVVTLPLRGARQGDCTQPIRDLDHIRNFLSGTGPIALFDMPFVPVFFAACFLIHPWLGIVAVVGAAIVVILTILTEARSRGPMKDVTNSLAERHAVADTSRRNAEAVKALGMAPHLRARFTQAGARHVTDSLRASAVVSGIGVAAKVFRMVLQSSTLGLGAYLVIRNEMSGGSMVAASIMMSRALAPIEIAVANWKTFISARHGLRRLEEMLATLPVPGKPLPLPAPVSSLTVEDMYVAPPGMSMPTVHAASFHLEAGQGLGLIGPSASGKSSLARALVSVWPALRGEIRLDGASLAQWDPSLLGRHIGYLPQDVELFDGTVADNIARFQGNMDAKDIIAAAQTAGAHDMILRLPEGYETRIGEGGAVLSGGQRQRVALARALFGEPFLIVLDEPDANLDGAGDQALNDAILAVRKRGGIVIVITHRASALGNIDLVAIMGEGRIRSIGPRDNMLKSVMRRSTFANVSQVTAQTSNEGELREAG